MSNQHTPEPWAWQQFGKEWCLTGQHGMRPIVLAVRKGGLTSLKNGLLVPLDPSHPDARLIAASPDLLKALITLRNDCYNKEGEIVEPSGLVLDATDELIKKFEGVAELDAQSKRD